MSKVKPPKHKGVPNKHLHARTTFLYQAATYLTLQTTAEGTKAKSSVKHGEQAPHYDEPHAQKHSPTALQLGFDLQQVSRKAQLRLSVDLKRSMCKSCNTILVPGRTATQAIENHSKGGKKAWADVCVLECNFCGSKKRFPIGAKKQPKKIERKVVPMEMETTSIIASEDTPQSESALMTGTDQNSTTG